ncbi:hypothetical protein AM500_18885 [Bacillus sp. FJAT-18017]|nr:hypothetical protein AM500_18885 [Bacillus sp. FJAT-18017]
MSLDHIKTMLETLKHFGNCEITLTFNSNQDPPILSVCFQENHFQITYLNNHNNETYDDNDSTSFNKKCPSHMMFNLSSNLVRGFIFQLLVFNLFNNAYEKMR